jgi:hypothetical protein
VLQTVLDTNSTQNIIMTTKAQVHLIPWLYGGEFFQVKGDAGTFTGPEWETQSGPVSKCHFEMYSTLAGKNNKHLMQIGVLYNMAERTDI